MFNNIDEIINQFYQEKIQIGKIYKLLRNIKQRLNTNSKVIILFHKPTNIAVFYQGIDKLVLITSTNFINKHEYKDGSGFLNSEARHQVFRNFEICYDSMPVEPNLAYRISHGGATYLFIISISDSQPTLLRDKISHKVYYPIIYKISKLLEIEREIVKERKEYIKKIKKKMVFVDGTIKAIHFLNNRLTPIANYFDLMKKSENIEDEDVKRELQLIINQERKKSTSNIDFIIERMKRTLEKSNNPYIISSNEPVGVRRMFSIVRKSWQDSNFEIESIQLNCSEDFLKREVMINIESFEFVLDELLSNILKHSELQKDVEVTQENEWLVIKLSNDIRDYNRSVENLRKIVTYFNSDEINEVLKKTSYGLSYIKDALKQLNIVHNMLLTEDKRILILLKIKTQIHNEDTFV